MRIYFWKCCGIEHKLKDMWDTEHENLGNLGTAKIYLEKHELSKHKGKKVGTFGYYLKD